MNVSLPIATLLFGYSQPTSEPLITTTADPFAPSRFNQRFGPHAEAFRGVIGALRSRYQLVVERQSNAALLSNDIQRRIRNRTIDLALVPVALTVDRYQLTSFSTPL